MSQSPSDPQRLAQVTDWQEGPGGAYTGRGQRLWLAAKSAGRKTAAGVDGSEHRQAGAGAADQEGLVGGADELDQLGFAGGGLCHQGSKARALPSTRWGLKPQIPVI